MSNIPTNENIAVRSLFGVFPVDPYGTVGDLFGVWHRTMESAEVSLVQIRGHYGNNYTALSRVEHEQRLKEQRAAGLSFKTGHDVLMTEFDEWLRANHLLRGADIATKLGLSDKEFKSLVKKGLVKPQMMPNHDNLAGYPANFSLTTEQHEMFANERTLNAHQVAEALGITQKEFNEIRRETNIARSEQLLGHTVPSDSGTSFLYCRSDIDKLRPATEEYKAKRAATSQAAEKARSRE